MTYTIQKQSKVLFSLDICFLGRELHFDITEPSCGWAVLDESYQVVKQDFTTRTEAENYCQDMGYRIEDY